MVSKVYTVNKTFTANTTETTKEVQSFSSLRGRVKEISFTFPIGNNNLTRVRLRDGKGGAALCPSGGGSITGEGETKKFTNLNIPLFSSTLELEGWNTDTLNTHAIECEVVVEA